MRAGAARRRRARGERRLASSRFGAGRVHEDDSEAFGEQPLYPLHYAGKELLWKALCINGGVLVYKKLAMVALVEPLLERRL
jgi:hypothetical protein